MIVVHVLGYGDRGGTGTKEFLEELGLADAQNYSVAERNSIQKKWLEECDRAANDGDAAAAARLLGSFTDRAGNRPRLWKLISKPNQQGQQIVLLTTDSGAGATLPIAQAYQRLVKLIDPEGRIKIQVFNVGPLLSPSKTDGGKHEESQLQNLIDYFNHPIDGFPEDDQNLQPVQLHASAGAVHLMLLVAAALYSSRREISLVNQQGKVIPVVPGADNLELVATWLARRGLGDSAVSIYEDVDPRPGWVEELAKELQKQNNLLNYANFSAPGKTEVMGKLAVSELISNDLGSGYGARSLVYFMLREVQAQYREQLERADIYQEVDRLLQSYGQRAEVGISRMLKQNLGVGYFWTLVEREYGDIGGRKMLQKLWKLGVDADHGSAFHKDLSDYEDVISRYLMPKAVTPNGSVIYLVPVGQFNALRPRAEIGQTLAKNPPSKYLTQQVLSTDSINGCVIYLGTVDADAEHPTGTEGDKEGKAWGLPAEIGNLYGTSQTAKWVTNPQNTWRLAKYYSEKIGELAAAKQVDSGWAEGFTARFADPVEVSAAADDIEEEYLEASRVSFRKALDELEQVPEVICISATGRRDLLFGALQAATDYVGEHGSTLLLQSKFESDDETSLDLYYHPVVYANGMDEVLKRAARRYVIQMKLKSAERILALGPVRLREIGRQVRRARRQLEAGNCPVAFKVHSLEVLAKALVEEGKSEKKTRKEASGGKAKALKEEQTAYETLTVNRLVMKAYSDLDEDGILSAPNPGKRKPDGRFEPQDSGTSSLTSPYETAAWVLRQLRSSLPISHGFGKIDVRKPQDASMVVTKLSPGKLLTLLEAISRPSINRFKKIALMVPDFTGPRGSKPDPESAYHRLMALRGSPQEALQHAKMMLDEPLFNRGRDKADSPGTALEAVVEELKGNSDE